MEPLPVLLLGCIAGLSLSLSRLGAALGLRRPRRAAAASTDRSLSELREGDVVQHGRTTMVVRRALCLTAAGRWRQLCELEADGAPWLLLAGEEGAGEDESAWLLSLAPQLVPELLTAVQAPATESLAHDGIHYRLLGRYLTQVAQAAQAATPTGERLPLWCYRGPGACRLLVTRWPDDSGARLYAGLAVLPQSLTVLAR